MEDRWRLSVTIELKKCDEIKSQGCGKEPASCRSGEGQSARWHRLDTGCDVAEVKVLRDGQPFTAPVKLEPRE